MLKQILDLLGVQTDEKSPAQTEQIQGVVQEVLGNVLPEVKQKLAARGIDVSDPEVMEKVQSMVGQSVGHIVTHVTTNAASALQSQESDKPLDITQLLQSLTGGSGSGATASSGGGAGASAGATPLGAILGALLKNFTSETDEQAQRTQTAQQTSAQQQTGQQAAAGSGDVGSALQQIFPMIVSMTVKHLATSYGADANSDKLKQVTSQLTDEVKSVAEREDTSHPQ